MRKWVQLKKTLLKLKHKNTKQQLYNPRKVSATRVVYISFVGTPHKVSLSTLSDKTNVDLFSSH